MLEIILDSGNAHKALEFGELFDPSVIKVSAAADKLEVDETGTTYSENALLKAQAYYEKYKKPEKLFKALKRIVALWKFCFLFFIWFD